MLGNVPDFKKLRVASTELPETRPCDEFMECALSLLRDGFGKKR